MRPSPSLLPSLPTNEICFFFLSIGNELNYRGMRPAPASWTLTIARHLKARGKQLVMDGSFARADDPESCYNAEVLESPDVDILSCTSKSVVV